MISGEEIHSSVSSDVSAEDEWGEAQRRLILYLQWLKIPPFEVLELALEALKRAGEKSGGTEGGAPRVTASMRALRRLLTKHEPSGKIKADTRQMMLLLPFLEKSHLLSGIKSMPMLNRGTMLPEKARQRVSSHPTSQTDHS